MGHTYFHVGLRNDARAVILLARSGSRCNNAATTRATLRASPRAPRPAKRGPTAGGCRSLWRDAAQALLQQKVRCKACRTKLVPLRSPHDERDAGLLIRPCKCSGYFHRQCLDKRRAGAPVGGRRFHPAGLWSPEGCNICSTRFELARRPPPRTVGGEPGALAVNGPAASSSGPGPGAHGKRAWHARVGGRVSAAWRALDPSDRWAARAAGLVLGEALVLLLCAALWCFAAAAGRRWLARAAGVPAAGVYAAQVAVLSALSVFAVAAQNQAPQWRWRRALHAVATHWYWAYLYLLQLLGCVGVGGPIDAPMSHALLVTAAVAAEVLAGQGAWRGDRCRPRPPSLLPLQARAGRLYALWKEEFVQCYAVVDQLPRRVWRANKAARRAARRMRKKVKGD